MIHPWGIKCVRAVLADGRASIGRLDDDSILWADPIHSEFEIEKAWESAILTGDGRILVDVGHWRLIDITQEVHKLFGGVVDISYIYCNTQIIVIITSDAVGLFSLNPPESEAFIRYSIIHRFPCEITSYTTVWSRRYGFVSADKGLFWLEIGNSQEHLGSPGYWRVEAEIVETASICGISSNSFFTMLLTEDGRVYAQKNRWHGGIYIPFKQIMIPHGEHVIKIVMTLVDVFYVTAAGNCFYSKTGMGNWEEPPVQLNLQGYHIENIQELGHNFVVWSDRGLCILHVVKPQRSDGSFFFLYKTRRKILKQYSSGTIQPHLLPFSDNIVRAEMLLERIYFFTDEGHAYWTNSLDDPSTTITRDLFFDTNPLAVEKSTCSIRSARSVVRTNTC